MVPIVKLIYNSNNYGLYVIVDGVYKPNYKQKGHHIVSFLYDSIFSSCLEIDGESPGPLLRCRLASVQYQNLSRRLPCDGGN